VARAILSTGIGTQDYPHGEVTQRLIENIIDVLIDASIDVSIDMPTNSSFRRHGPMFNDIQQTIVSSGVYPGVTVAVAKEELNDYMNMRMAELHALTIMMGDESFFRSNPAVISAIVGMTERVAAEMKQLVSGAFPRRA
jgi:hypothetical protein